MKTQTEALSWIDQKVGKSLDYDGHYGFQCVDLVAYYCQFLGISPYTGNARYWWESGYDGNGLLERTTTFSNGAIAVFKPNAGNGNAGHIACGREDKGGSFRSLDQNWYNASANGSPAAWVTHAKDNNIYGYLKPRFTGGEQMPNDGDIINAMKVIRHDPNYQPKGSEFDYYKKPENGWNRLHYDYVFAAQQDQDSALGIAGLRDGYLKDIGKSGGFNFPVVEQPQVNQMKQKISGPLSSQYTEVTDKLYRKV